MLRRVALRCAAAWCEATPRAETRRRPPYYTGGARRLAREMPGQIADAKRDDECADKPQDGSKSLPIDPPAQFFQPEKLLGLGVYQTGRPSRDARAASICSASSSALIWSLNS
jgi:hypothetical protein